MGEISDVTSSKRVYLSDYVNQGIPFFRGKEISLLKEGSFPKDVLYIKESRFLEFKEKYGAPQEGDILVTSVGTLGNIYRVDIDSGFYFKDGNLIWLRNIVESSFFLEKLLNYKKSILLKNVIGSTQKALTIIGVKKTEVLLPSLPEQQKIAEFLSSVDEWIERLRAERQAWERYKKGMMQKLFTQEIRFRDENGDDFPEWEEKKLGEVAEINPSNADLPKDFIYIDLESVKQGKLKEEKPIKKGSAPSRAQRILRKNDILFQAVRPYQQNNLFFDLEGQYVASTGYAHIRTVQNPLFLYYSLFTSAFLNKVLARCTGTNYPAINSTDLGKIKVCIPSLPEQQKIADFLTSLDKVIESKDQQIAHVEQWKKGLMQRLFV